MGWFESSYRNLFFDFHTHSTASDVGREFDAEAWADELVKANVQAVSTVAKCHYGWNYYLKGTIGAPHPNLRPGLDIVGETIEACHKRGIHVIAYYNLIGFETLSVQREDWCERDAQGRKTYRGIGMCLMTPILEEQIIPQLREIARNYDIDGATLDYPFPRMCYCEHCRRRFREAMNLELPADSRSPHWKRFIEWKVAEYRQIQRKLVEAVHLEKPDVEVNLNAAYWSMTPERPPAEVGFLWGDIPFYNIAAYGSMMSRYWATSGKPFAVMNQAFLRLWGYWGVKKEIALKQECATFIANTGRACIGFQMYPQFKVEPAVMSTLGAALAFVRERESLCAKARPVPYIAVSWSTRSNMTHRPAFEADDVALKGAHKILTESGFHYNIVTDEDLEEKIDDYKAVILPDQRYISTGLADALQRFVRRGGGLIATYRTGTLDERLEPREGSVLAEVLGVRLEGECPGYSAGPDTPNDLGPHAYFELADERLRADVLRMPIQVFGSFACARSEGAETLARLRGIYLRGDGHYLLNSSPPGEDTGYPAITLNRFGQGRAAYICGNVFFGYLMDSEWNLKHIIRNLLNLVLPEKLVEIEGPNRVEVVLTQRGRERMVHLINQDGDRPLAGSHPRAYAICITEQILPIFDIGVKVKYAGRPRQVTLEPGGRSLEWRAENGMVSFRVPRLDIHACVLIR
jgi:hypothetical protein